jgi:HAMP domain-containing protein
MRLFLIAIPLAVCASPVLAQPAPAPQLPRELTDPVTADKLGKMAGALSKALLDLPVGEIQAAAEGRPATAADRRRTVRDMAARGDPNIERTIERQAAASGVAMQAGIKAMANALPAIMDAVERAAGELDRATANLPQPGYPRR